MCFGFNSPGAPIGGGRYGSYPEAVCLFCDRKRFRSHPAPHGDPGLGDHQHSKKKIELVLELGEWDTHQEYDRLGFEEEKFSILEVELPMMRIPVTPARNLTTIIEVAVRNHLLKVMGYDSALEFEKKLLRKIEERGGDRFEIEDEVE
jgi:hypothetical protein